MRALAPRRMWFVIDYLSGTSGGTEGQLLALIRGVSGRGVSPRLIALRPTEFTRSGDLEGCPVSTLHIRQVLHVGSLFRLFRFAWRIRRERVELVHVFFNDSAMIIPWFAKLGGSKVVTSRRDMGYWYTWANLRLLRLANRFVDRFLVNSRAVAEHVMARERVRRERIRVIYNGYLFGAEAGPALVGLRERIGAGEKDPIVGIVANLRPVKRHGDLLEAFARVLRNHPRAHLLLLGTGPLEAALLARVAALGIGSSVHFLGSHRDVIPFVKHFDVGVLCSESEGFSNAVIEYMACGVPTVCTNVGGNPELIRDGVDGYLVEPGDVPALASRIEALLNDRALARTLGENARARVQEYTLDRMVEAHLESYAEILHDGGGD
jgi:glycosyltransferase involved in cell wall biosynthesis